MSKLRPVGLDVHAERIAVAVTEAGGEVSYTVLFKLEARLEQRSAQLQ